jgi:hypothetical protein
MAKRKLPRLKSGEPVIVICDDTTECTTGWVPIGMDVPGGMAELHMLGYVGAVREGALHLFHGKSFCPEFHATSGNFCIPLGCIKQVIRLRNALPKRRKNLAHVSARNPH